MAQCLADHLVQRRFAANLGRNDMEISFLIIALLTWLSPSFNKLISGTMFTFGYIVLNSGCGILHPNERYAYVIGFFMFLAVVGVPYLAI